MLKPKLMLFTFFAASALVFVSSATANAQTFPNPTAQRTEEARRSGPCRDPWITIAIFFATAGTRKIAGVGNVGECNPALYNGGSWSSYNELEHGVERALSALNRAGVSYSMASLAGGKEIKLLDGGVVVEKILTNAGGNVVSHDGGSLVASGGGNYTVQSTASEKRINLGKSVLIIRKK